MNIRSEHRKRSQGKIYGAGEEREEKRDAQTSESRSARRREDSGRINGGKWPGSPPEESSSSSTMRMTDVAGGGRRRKKEHVWQSRNI